MGKGLGCGARILGSIPSVTECRFLPKFFRRAAPPSHPPISIPSPVHTSPFLAPPAQSMCSLRQAQVWEWGSMWVSAQLPLSGNSHIKLSLHHQGYPPSFPPKAHPKSSPPPPLLKGFSVWGHPLTSPLERTPPPKEVIQGLQPKERVT